MKNDPILVSGEVSRLAVRWDGVDIAVSVEAFRIAQAYRLFTAGALLSHLISAPTGWAVELNVGLEEIRAFQESVYQVLHSNLLTRALADKIVNVPHRPRGFGAKVNVKPDAT